MYNLKARNGWSDIGFSKFLSLLGDVLPKDNNIPMYEEKKILRALGMEYEKLHTCPNDCILYRKEFMNISKCLVRHISRWNKHAKGEDKTGIPTKMLWYIPPTLRFKHFFGMSNM